MLFQLGICFPFTIFSCSLRFFPTISLWLEQLQWQSNPLLIAQSLCWFIITLKPLLITNIGISPHRQQHHYMVLHQADSILHHHCICTPWKTEVKEVMWMAEDHTQFGPKFPFQIPLLSTPTSFFSACLGGGGAFHSLTFWWVGRKKPHFRQCIRCRCWLPLASLKPVVTT